MLHKLEQEGLKADLGSVNTILSRMSEEKDPIGYSQFLARRKEIEEALQALGDVPEAAGKVALLFGGRPVWGSQGIEADFAAKAIDSFQRAVAAQAAGAAGPVGARGKLPQDVATPLLVTNVGRGSFGFILEEAKKNEQMIESSMHHALDQIASLARGAGAQDEESFIAAVAAIQRRALQAIAEFFKQLEENGALLRLVEDEEDITLDAEAIARARSRTEQTQIDEDTFEEEGVLVGLVPAQKRFEWHRPDGKIVVGTVEGDIAKDYETSLFEEHPLLGPMRARIAVRTVTRRGGSPHLTYTLLSVGSKSDK